MDSATPSLDSKGDVAASRAPARATSPKTRLLSRLSLLVLSVSNGHPPPAQRVRLVSQLRDYTEDLSTAIRSSRSSRGRARRTQPPSRPAWTSCGGSASGTSPSPTSEVRPRPTPRTSANARPLPEAEGAKQYVIHGVQGRDRAVRSQRTTTLTLPSARRQARRLPAHHATDDFSAWARAFLKRLLATLAVFGWGSSSPSSCRGRSRGSCRTSPTPRRRGQATSRSWSPGADRSRPTACADLQQDGRAAARTASSRQLHFASAPRRSDGWPRRWPTRSATP